MIEHTIVPATATKTVPFKGMSTTDVIRELLDYAQGRCKDSLIFHSDYRWHSAENKAKPLEALEVCQFAINLSIGHTYFVPILDYILKDMTEAVYDIAVTRFGQARSLLKNTSMSKMASHFECLS